MTQKFALYKPKSSIIFPGDAQLPESVPTKTFEYRGRTLKACQHNLPNTLVLRDLGYEIQSPIVNWDFPLVKNRFEPFEHQRKTVEFATYHKRACFLLDMGLGKTYSTLAAAHWLMKEGVIKRVLVLAPLSTLNTTWVEELFSSFLQYGRTYAVLHGAAEKRSKMLDMGTDFLIANHHLLMVAVKNRKDKHGNEYLEIAKGFEALLDVDLIIFDESSEVRNGETHLAKALGFLLKPQTRLWLLSGAPCPSGPTGAWSQARLINPNNVPKYFGAWRRQTCNEIKIGPFSKWEPKAGSEHMVFQALQPAIQFFKRDAVDLPPVTIERRRVELSAAQNKMYKTMLREMQAEATAGTISASNASHKMLMLRQIVAGSVKADDEYHKIDCKPRIDAAIEVMEHCGGKVVIFVPFVGILHLLKDSLQEYFDKQKRGEFCEVIYGDVGSKDRDRIIQDFNQKGSGARALVCQINSVSHGVQLQGDCSCAIYFAPPTGNNAYQQSKSRLDRLGQKHNVLIVQLSACNMEDKLFQKLDDDEDFQAAVLELYKQGAEGTLDK